MLSDTVLNDHRRPASPNTGCPALVTSPRPGGTDRRYGATALSFVSILSVHDARLWDITDLVGHSSTSVTETVYRHEIRPALTENGTGR